MESTTPIYTAQKLKVDESLKENRKLERVVGSKTKIKIYTGTKRSWSSESKTKLMNYFQGFYLCSKASENKRFVRSRVKKVNLTLILRWFSRKSNLYSSYIKMFLYLTWNGTFLPCFSRQLFVEVRGLECLTGNISRVFSQKKWSLEWSIESDRGVTRLWSRMIRETSPRLFIKNRV